MQTPSMDKPSAEPGLLSQVFEHLPEPACVTGLAGEFVRANEAFCGMLGYSEAELRGLDVPRITHPDDLGAQRSLVQELLAGQREAYRMRKRYLHKTGRVVVGHVRSTVLRARDGRVLGLIGITNPVDAAADAMAQNYRALFENNFDGVYLLDRQGRFVAGNLGLQRIIGYEEAELLGESFLMYIEPQHRELRQRMFERALAGETVNYDTVARHKSGELRYTNVTKLPMVVDGQVAGVFAIAKDISERILHAQELAALNASLEDRVRARTSDLEALVRGLEAFTAAASHDLRGPLQRIAGFTGALAGHLADRADARSTHYLQRILASVQQMEQLTEGLLDLARATRADMLTQAVDLSALAAQVVAALAEREPHRHVRCDIAPGLQARGDPRLVRQVLENLLGNAWKFTLNQEEPCLAFTAEQGPQGPAFCVSDNGPGFEMAQAERLFRPFERLHANAQFGGSGIGLATVQAIVSRHNGRVWAESAPGRGARFYFTLGPGTQC